MIYYFIKDDILPHKSYARKALEHGFGGKRELLCRRRRVTLQAKELGFAGLNAYCISRHDVIINEERRFFFVKHLVFSEKRSTFAGKYTRERHLLNHFIN